MKKLNAHIRIGLLAGAIAFTLNALAEAAPLAEFVKGMCTGLSITFIVAGAILNRKHFKVAGK